MKKHFIKYKNCNFTTAFFVIGKKITKMGSLPNSRKSLLVALLLICPMLVVHSQPRQLQFTYLTPNDGLSSSAVINILQDHHDFMWIGTYDGLNRYDGNEFVVYKSDAPDPGSLQCDQIRAIHEDEENNLFIGTNCGLSLYNPDYDNFLNFMAEDSSALFGIDCNVYCITGIEPGKLWLSTNIGLIFFDWKNNTSEIFAHDPDNPETISNNWVEYTYIDSKGRMWVSTRGGLDLFNPGTKTFRHVAKGVYSGDEYSRNTFLQITEDHGGNIWIGSYNGLYCLENTSENEDELTWYGHVPGNPHSISPNRLLSLFVDSQNNLWIGAENDGLFLLNREENNFWHYKTNDYDPAGLNNESIQVVYFDKSGNLWLGTFGGGINIASGGSEGIIHFKTLKGSDESLSYNVVSAFHEDRKGRIWIGTDGGGLNLYNKKTSRFKRYNMANSALSSNSILSIIEDKNHNFWMGTWGGGLIRFNPETNRFSAFTTLNSQIPDNNIFSVELGGNNDLWLGSYRNGLIHFDISGNKFTSYNETNSAIGNNYVYVIRKDRKGQLYLGTTTGLKIYSPEEDEFTIYGAALNDPHRVSHGTIYDILIENDTSVWVGTQKGLNRFNPETGIFTKFYMEDGLPNDVIKGLVFDKTGILWATTNGGVCRFDYKNKIDIYTREDGLQSDEFNYKTTMLSGEGNLYLGGVNGFNIISPDKFAKNERIPAIHITGIDIFNQPVKPNAPGSPLKSNISDAGEIILTH